LCELFTNHLSKFDHRIRKVTDSILLPKRPNTRTHTYVHRYNPGK